MRKQKNWIMVLTAVIAFGVMPTIASATSAVVIDFDAAAAPFGIGSPSDVNDGLGGPNGIDDFDEFGVVSAVLADPTHLSHDVVHAAYTEALTNAQATLIAILGSQPAIDFAGLTTLPPLMAAAACTSNITYATLQALVISINALIVFPTANPLAAAMDPLFDISGDVDGDGATNLQEHNFGAGAGGGAAYIAAVIDPLVTPTFGLSVSITGNGGAQAPGGTIILTGVLAVTAGGETVQWQKDGVDIGGETGLVLTIASSVVGDTGDYTLVVSGTSTETSNVISVNIIAGLPAAKAFGLMLLVVLMAITGIVLKRKVSIS